MATALDNVRVEVAFDADPNTTTPGFRDLTSYVSMANGVSINRGRERMDDDVQPGSCSLTFENLDGRFTPGLASSPYYPNVKPQNRVRVTYRDPAVDGNLVSANAASLETSAADWGSTTGFGAYTLCTVAQSAVRAWVGTKSLQITWPLTAGGSLAVTTVTGLVIGRTYTFSSYVWVPTGVPNVQMTIALIANGTATAVKDAWVRISVTWVATQTTIQVGPRTTGSTAGQLTWMDGFQADEGATVRTFTTSAAPIVYRFDGYVHQWPTVWPTGGQTYSNSTVSCYDLAARLSRKRSLGSVIAETYRLNTPLFYYTLSEPSESVSAGDLMGSANVLTVEQVGTGGTLEFASATGPPTDGASSPQFTPATAAFGQILTGTPTSNDPTTFAVTLEATFATPGLAGQTVAYWSDAYGFSFELALNGSGNVVANYYNPWTTTSSTTTSPLQYNDGETHTVAATLTGNGSSSSTVTLFMDGVQVATSTFATSGFVPTFTFISVGGRRSGSMFYGTISHVAAFPVALTAPQLLEHRNSTWTGFTGETTDQRIARIASWAGLPAGLQALDVGITTVGHVDPTGKSPWAYMHEVAHAEAGTLFVSTSGILTYYSRSRSYDTALAVTAAVTADEASPDTSLEQTMDDIINVVTVSRPGGATIRLENAASILAYGEAEASVDIITDTDADLYSRASWLLNSAAEPVSRLSHLSLDALTVTAAAGARALEIGQRVQVTGMPSQAPAASFDLRVLGYSEDISTSGWDLVANTADFMPITPFILDDATYGVLDDDRLVY